MLKIRNLESGYGKLRVLKKISMHVDAGEIVTLIGANGAGKSTTIKILTTLALPTDGRATVGGFDVVTQAEEVRRIAGVALQEIGIDHQKILDQFRNKR